MYWLGLIIQVTSSEQSAISALQQSREAEESILAKEKEISDLRSKIHSLEEVCFFVSQIHFGVVQWS